MITSIIQGKKIRFTHEKIIPSADTSVLYLFLNFGKPSAECCNLKICQDFRSPGYSRLFWPVLPYISSFSSSIYEVNGVRIHKTDLLRAYACHHTNKVSKVQLNAWKETKNREKGRNFNFLNSYCLLFEENDPTIIFWCFPFAFPFLSESVHKKRK
jgi:hypothetical protein